MSALWQWWQGKCWSSTEPQVVGRQRPLISRLPPARLTTTTNTSLDLGQRVLKCHCLSRIRVSEICEDCMLKYEIVVSIKNLWCLESQPVSLYVKYIQRQFLHCTRCNQNLDCLESVPGHYYLAYISVYSPNLGSDHRLVPRLVHCCDQQIELSTIICIVSQCPEPEKHYKNLRHYAKWVLTW